MNDATLSLGELSTLAATANAQHRALISVAANMVEHAVACGDALIAARHLVPPGDWGRWVASNLEFTSSVAQKYTRLARNKHLLTADHVTIQGAMTYLSKAAPPEPASAGAWRRDPLTEVELADAKAMRGSGASWKAIGIEFGCSDQTIRRRLDPSYAKHMSKLSRQSNLRLRAARKELRAKEIARHVAAAGGDASVAYAAIRKAALAIDKAIASTEENDAKGLLARALAYAHKAEDEIVFALKADRRTERRPLPERAKNALHRPAPGDRKSAS